MTLYEHKKDKIKETIEKIGIEKYWFKEKQRSEFQIKGKLTKEKVIELSRLKKEPRWMLEKRLQGFEWFKKLDLPDWGPDLSKLDLDNVIWYSSPIENKPRTWDEIPEDIKNTFKKLGITEEEAKVLAGVGLQYDSEVIYKKVRDILERRGVIFLSMDEAVKKYPEIIRKYFGTVVPPADHKFAALNTAVWSGGTFIYVPKNVKVPIPLHTYFRINLEGIGQFERTLIIADKNSEVTYVEGCSAPMYSKSSLHAAVVELVALENSSINYVTIQNWSKNVYNLVTKRAIVHENARVRWVSASFGSKTIMLYPAVILKGENSKGEIVSLSVVSNNQEFDSGGRAIHVGKNTRSSIVSKTISFGNGKATFRGDVRIFKGAENAYATVKCDSLLEGNGKAETIPKIFSEEEKSYFNHEAKIERIEEEKMFYLMSKGLNKKQCKSLVYLGFFEDVMKKIPFEYALEIKRLLDLELEEFGGIG